MESVVTHGACRDLYSHDPDVHDVVVLPNFLDGHPPKYFPLIFGPISQSPLNIRVQGLVSSGLNDVHPVIDLETLETFEIKSGRINCFS